MTGDTPLTDDAPAASPRGGIVWLASYPKSGNTWTRAFLHNLMKTMTDESDVQDINALNRFSVGVNTRKFYEEVLGFVPTNQHRKEISAARHEVQRRIADQFDGVIFAKTHQALVMDRESTTVNLAVTSGAIYIIRNPLDVAISYAHHMNRSIDETITVMANHRTETPVNEKMVYEVYSSWDHHVLSWTRNTALGLHVMRYEDMVAEPVATFGALARHLLLYPTIDELSDAIERSSFGKLREQEDQKGFREKPEFAEKFFREGRSGQWKRVLNSEQIDRIVRNHGAQMERFGYLPG